MKQVSRYHPLLVTLHWLLAVLIIAMVFVGFFMLAATSNSDPGKINVLLWHMSGGMVILALMIIRFIVRLKTAKPPHLPTAYPVLDRVVPVFHYGFYVVILLMVTTGYTTALLAGLNRIAFQGSGDPLPPSFAAYPTFVAHFYLAVLLTGMIILHVLAAFYHQFALKDGLFRRLAFGRRM
jgi:cytochrome b561